MAKPSLILAIDQGTTSSRAIVYDQKLNQLGHGQFEFPQYFPENGWVEHDPDAIWDSTIKACRKAIQDCGRQAYEIACIGITNQRETTVVWDRKTGKPISRAIVWQDRRTSSFCNELKEQGHEELFQKRTGLLLDPYFSGTKLRWILDNVDGARRKAENGDLCFGTIDCYLLWRLTDGEAHATDASNASRTLLMNLETRQWDSELLEILNIPEGLLPEIRDNASDFGTTSRELFGVSIPVCSMVGDQQAALMGQGCIDEGQVKSTYGTGCFALVNTGSNALQSDNRMLTTLAWQLGGEPTYALEGSIFMAGAVVQWLRDKLGILQEAAESEKLAEGIPYSQSEMLIPAFTGLGAPYWDPEARAALFGMTRNTGRREISAAALRSVAYETRDLLRAMIADGQDIDELRVDGGMTDNGWFMQALADITGHPVLRSNSKETTVRGAAFLAGLQAGLFESLQDIQEFCSSKGRFKPEISEAQRDELYDRWLAAVEKVR